MQRDMQSNQNILHKLEVDGDMQGLKKSSWYLICLCVKKLTF
jgi:hypothetical protein